MHDDTAPMRPHTAQHEASAPEAPHAPEASLDSSHPGWFAHASAMALLTRFTTIHGYADLLARVLNRQPVDLDRVRHYSQTMQQQIHDLGHLLDQYVHAMTMHEGALTLSRRPTRLDELTAAVRVHSASMAERSERHELVIAQTEPVSGNWDPHWLTRAIAALVSNAFKYTPDGGRITVDIERQGEFAVLTVADPGRGITANERNTIFQPFVRGSAARGGIPGWGLGLFIAAQAVQAHGGQIDVTSAPQRGTTMTIRLPMTAEHLA